MNEEAASQIVREIERATSRAYDIGYRAGIAAALDRIRQFSAKLENELPAKGSNNAPT